MDAFPDFGLVGRFAVIKNFSKILTLRQKSSIKDFYDALEIVPYIGQRDDPFPRNECCFSGSGIVCIKCIFNRIYTFI